MEIFAEAVALKILRPHLRPQGEIDRSFKNLDAQPHGDARRPSIAMQTSWRCGWHADNMITLLAAPYISAQSVGGWNSKQVEK
jgi:hypothetical protein